MADSLLCKNARPDTAALDEFRDAFPRGPRRTRPQPAPRSIGPETDWAAGTQNRVTLRVYPGGVAGDEPDLVRKMRIGQLQAAAVTTAGLANIDPAFNVFNIPMFFTSYPELYATLTKLEPILRQRLEEKGFVLLSWGHGGWVYFFTKAPVNSVEGLRKTKMFVWAGDDRMVALWKSQGFNPVPLAATDIMSSLQTGMIDSYPTTPLLGLTLQWYRQTPNMVGMGMAPLVGELVMTKTAWPRSRPRTRSGSWPDAPGCSDASKSRCRARTPPRSSRCRSAASR